MGGLGRVVSGAILIFAGAGQAATLSLPTTDTATAETDYPTIATATYSLSSTGAITSDTGGVWLTPASLSGNYDVRATVQSGSLSTGTVGSFENLGTTRTWTLSRNTVGGSGAVVLFEICATGTTSPVLDQVTVTFTATVGAP